MARYSVMLKPASSACNLRCKYCFYADLAGKRDTFCFGSMSRQTAREILTNLSRQLQRGDMVEFAFQGGEPTLVGLDWFRDFFSMCGELLKEQTVTYALQTNGTLLDDQWGEFLGKHQVLVGLSVDADAPMHNSCRVDTHGQGTYPQVMAAAALLRKHRVEFNILCTLTREIARHPLQVWKWICKHDFRYVQFTPCLDELDAPGQSDYALRPDRFADFYIRLFPLWFRDFQEGRYRSIKFFDDVVNLLAFGMPTACGIHGACQCQMVVEADGSAYPCDFYCLDEYRLGDLRKDSLVQMVQSERARAFVSREREASALCEECPYRNFCGRGCRRMQREVYCGSEDKRCGYRSFLDYAMPALQQIARQQRMMRRM